jgi:hypothetical protein
MTTPTHQHIQTLLLEECHQSLNLAQWCHRVALFGYATSIGLAISATTLVYSGRLDAVPASSLATLPIVACTRALHRGGKQLREETDRLCHLIETLDQT